MELQALPAIEGNSLEGLEKEVSSRYVKIDLNITGNTNCRNLNSVTSPNYSIGEHVGFHFKILSVYNNLLDVSESIYHFFVYILVKATYMPNIVNNRKIKLLSKDLNMNSVVNTSDEKWHFIANVTAKTNHLKFYIIACLEDDTGPRYNQFSAMHDDTELMDFELRSDDGGCVAVHKVVLAAACPVLRRMLSGEWKESSQGHVVIPGISKTTLQQFKDYVYTYKLPATGVEKLLPLASMYLMTELERECKEAIVDSVTHENAIETIEMCVRNNLKNILLEVLKRVDEDMVRKIDIQLN